jgi:hypothetical protein
MMMVMMYIGGMMGVLVGMMMVLLREVRKVKEELKEVKRIVVWMQKTEEEIVEEWM